jgi:hypothetical protein
MGWKETESSEKGSCSCSEALTTKNQQLKTLYGLSGLSNASETAKPVTSAANAIAYQMNLLLPALIGWFWPHDAGVAGAGTAPAARAGSGSRTTR